MDPARLVVTVLGLGLVVAVNLYFFAGRSGERGASGRARRGRGKTGRED